MFRKAANIYLRPFEADEGDGSHIYDYFYDQDYAAFFRDYQRPLSLAECNKFPEVSGANVFSIIKSDAELMVGFITLHDYRPAAGVVRAGIVINKEHQGQRLALQALWILMDYCFNTLRLNKVICEAVESNARILKLIKEVGADHEGTFLEDAVVNGKLETVLRYALRSERTKGVIKILEKDLRG